ncbi:MAG: hypothetical protein CMM86_09455 [Rhodovulum sp.]|nr:hypothetical protein [Rhodovulum sp.]
MTPLTDAARDLVDEWGNATPEIMVAALKAAIRDGGGTWPDTITPGQLFEIQFGGVVAVGTSENDAARVWFDLAIDRTFAAMAATGTL